MKKKLQVIKLSYYARRQFIEGEMLLFLKQFKPAIVKKNNLDIHTVQHYNLTYRDRITGLWHKILEDCRVFYDEKGYANVKFTDLDGQKYMRPGPNIPFALWTPKNPPPSTASIIKARCRKGMIQYPKEIEEFQAENKEYEIEEKILEKLYVTTGKEYDLQLGIFNKMFKDTRIDYRKIYSTFIPELLQPLGLERWLDANSKLKNIKRLRLKMDLFRKRERQIYRLKQSNVWKINKRTKDMQKLALGKKQDKY